MNDILQFLQNRNSAPRLVAPAPDEGQLEQIWRAALRAPDHAWLSPWRLITVSGERRQALGEQLESCLLLRNPDADQAARAKARGAPLRAPLIVVVVACLQEHHKVPRVEQRLSAGCVAHGILLAAEALGYAGIWRTGDPAFDRNLMDALGLARNEEIIGFLYLGTREGAAKSLPRRAPADFVSSW